MIFVLHNPTASDDQISYISSKIDRHRGIKVKIITENSPDLSPFGNQLEKIFKLAGWDVVENSISFDKSYDGISLKFIVTLRQAQDYNYRIVTHPV
jgi:hypothetical protein